MDFSGKDWSKPAGVNTMGGSGLMAAFGGPAGAITAGASFLSGLFGARSARKQQKRQNKFEFQKEKYFEEMERKRQLEDRRYAEEAIGGYRGYTPGRPLMAPSYTDPSTINPKIPKFG